jgi:hypothetical protein
LVRGGITEQFHIDLAGAGFEFAILLGGIIIGGYVDKTKQYKTVTQWCLAATAFFVLPLGLTDHAMGHEPLLLILSLLGLGLAAGTSKIAKVGCDSSSIVDAETHIVPKSAFFVEKARYSQLMQNWRSMLHILVTKQQSKASSKLAAT